MTILLWLLALVIYIGFFLITRTVPGDINLGAGLVAIIFGLISFGASKRLLLLFSYGFLLLGLLLLWQYAFTAGYFGVWAVVIAVTLFFAALSQRGD
jgi:hypothetical protein